MTRGGVPPTAQRRGDEVPLRRRGAGGDAAVRRVAMLSVHTSPLDQPGTGDGGGLNVYVGAVGRRLAARGVEVDVYTRSPRRGAPAVVEVAPGFAVHHVDAGPPVRKEALAGQLWAFLLALEAHVDRHRPARSYDVVHAHYWLSGWVGRHLKERWGSPLVVSFHTLAEAKNAALPPGDPPEPPVRLAAERMLIGAADRIVVPVCGEARFLHRVHSVSGARIAVVPPGVDPRVFSPGAATNLSSAPPGDGPLLLFVGRLQPLKGPDVAVATLAAVRRTVPDARLLVVGGTSGNGAGRSGPAELAALARRLGVGDAVAVVPARAQPELAGLYRAAAVVVVPSRSESFGLVALEAQACGTPVVAADVGGLPAVVRGGGTLVAGHHPDDHARAVVAYLTDPLRRRRAGDVGAATALELTWERTTDGLVEAYASAAGVRAAAGLGA